MKVVLAITAEQSTKLQNLIAENNKDAAHYDNLVGCGDFLQFDHGFSFNPDQSIKVDGQRVEITGQRCALHADGILETLAKALSDEVEGMFAEAQKLPYDEISKARFLAWQAAKREFEQAYVVSYETSDSRLKWWERLSDIAEGLTIRELKGMTAEQLGGSSLDGNKTLARIRELLRKAAHENYSMTAVQAELDKDEMSVFTKMKNHLKNAYGYVF